MMIVESVVCNECQSEMCFVTLNHVRVTIRCHDCDWKIVADYVPHPELGKLTWSLEE
jgi:hypothetical protein